jgi:hypothetical protein
MNGQALSGAISPIHRKYGCGSGPKPSSGDPVEQRDHAGCEYERHIQQQNDDQHAAHFGIKPRGLAHDNEARRDAAPGRPMTRPGGLTSVKNRSPDAFGQGLPGLALYQIVCQHARK